MKKIVLLGIALITLFSQGTKAQIENAGQNYIKMQFVQPLGQYKDYYKSGFGVEFGRMFPLNFDIADGLILPGLDITFVDFTFNTGKQFDYFRYPNDDSGEWFSTQKGVMFNFSLAKIGPMITIGITDGLVADFAIQYVPTFVWSIRKGVDKNHWENNSTVKEKTASSFSYASRVGFKGDIRYSHFLFGLEFLVGSANLSYSSDILPTKEKGGDPKFINETSMGLGTLLLNFGFTF